MLQEILKKQIQSQRKSKSSSKKNIDSFKRYKIEDKQRILSSRNIKSFRRLKSIKTKDHKCNSIDGSPQSQRLSLRSQDVVGMKEKIKQILGRSQRTIPNRTSRKNSNHLEIEIPEKTSLSFDLQNNPSSNTHQSSLESPTKNSKYTSIHEDNKNKRSNFSKREIENQFNHPKVDKIKNPRSIDSQNMNIYFQELENENGDDKNNTNKSFNLKNNSFNSKKVKRASLNSLRSVKSIQKKSQILSNHKIVKNNKNKSKNNKRGNSYLCCLTKCLDFIFFFHLSNIFNRPINKKLKESDLLSLQPTLKISYLVDKFDSDQAIHGQDLSRNLFRLVKREMIIALILRIIEQSISITGPFIMASFIKHIIEPDQQIYETVALIVAAVMATFVSSLLKQHCNKYISKIKAKTGQCLRGIFASHILTSNYTFLKSADSSFIAKISVYDFDAITSFLGNIPNFAAFPVAFFISLPLIVFKVIGFNSLIMVPVFLSVLVLVGWIQRGLMNINIVYKKIGSKRTQVLVEMLKDIKSIKINSWQSFYEKKLVNIRNREVSLLKKISFYSAISNSLILLAPLVCSILIIFVKSLNGRNSIDISLSLAIVNVLNQLKKPLSLLGSSLDLYLDYKVGHTSLSKFLKLIAQRPKNDYAKPWLEVGEIKIFDCTSCVEDDVKTYSIIQDIYNLRHSDKESKQSRIKKENNGKMVLRELSSTKKIDKKYDGLKEKVVQQPSLPTDSKKSSKMSTTLKGQRTKVRKTSRNKSMFPSKEETARSLKNRVSRRKMNTNLNPINKGYRNTTRERKKSILVFKNKQKSRVKFPEITVNNSEEVKVNTPKSRKNKSVRRFSLFNQEGIINMVQLFKNGAQKTTNQQGLHTLHHDVTMCIKPGQVIALLGKAQSGAEGVLTTILEETKIVNGECHMYGSFSYMNLKDSFFLEYLTLRQNILLNQRYNKQRYHQVLSICELDISKFDGGDKVEVLEDAKNFSIWERKKIILARFLYSERDIYLFNHYFDDFDVCKSTSHFNDVIKDFLRDKTVIFISNKEQYVREADFIYIFDGGTIVDQGRYKDLLKSKKRYFGEIIETLDSQTPSKRYKSSNSIYADRRNFMNKMSNVFDPKLESSAKAGLINYYRNTASPVHGFRKRSDSLNNNISEFSDEPSDLGKRSRKGSIFKRNASPKKNHKIKKGVIKLIGGEKKSEVSNQEKKSLKVNKNFLGQLFKSIAEVHKNKSLTAYSSRDINFTHKTLSSELFKYLFLLGSCRLLILITMFMIAVVFLISNDIWLGVWSVQIIPSFGFFEYLVIYSLLSFFSGFSILSRDVLFNHIILKNSNHLHNSMIKKIMNSKMSWYIKNPSSKVTYLMSRDQSVIDMELNENIEKALDRVVIVVAGILVLSIIYWGIALIVFMVVILFLYFLLTRFYRSTSIIAQYTAFRKANVEAMYIHSLSNALHYRELCILHKLRDKFFTASDSFQRVSSHMHSLAFRWLGIRLLFLKSILVLLAYISLLLLIQQTFMIEDKSTLEWRCALAMVWSLKVISNIEELVIDITKVFNLLTSVARIFDYLDHKEIEWENKQIKQDPSYNFGSLVSFNTNKIVRMDGVSLLYGNKYALKKVSFSFERGRRIGILGYSGSGKHSLMNLILAISGRSEGSIKIFGVDIDKIIPTDLRQLSFYIESSPQLYGATIREFLDPQGQFETTMLIKILSYLGLYEVLYQNMESLFKEEGWGDISKNPHRKLQLYVNLASFISKEFSSTPKSKNKKDKLNQEFTKNIYQGLFSDMLFNQNEDGNIDINHSHFQPRISKNNINELIKNQPFSPMSRLQPPTINSSKLQSSTLSKMQRLSPQNINRNFQKNFNKSIRSPSDLEIQEKCQTPLNKRAVTRLESVDLDEPSQNQQKIISNFLMMQLINKGKNIPVNLKKMVILAKCILQNPKLLFIDEKGLEFGKDASWKTMFQKIRSVFSEETLIVFLHNIENIEHFDDLIIMHEGEILEQGLIKELIQRKESVFKMRIQKEDPILLNKILGKCGLLKESYSHDGSSETSKKQSGRQARLREEVFSSKSLEVGNIQIPPFQETNRAPLFSVRKEDSFDSESCSQGVERKLQSGPNTMRNVISSIPGIVGDNQSVGSENISSQRV